MGKLANQKKWLTVADAARRLASVFDEEVTESDVYRYALDSGLRLSVYFVNGAMGLGCITGRENNTKIFYFVFKIHGLLDHKVWKISYAIQAPDLTKMPLDELEGLALLHAWPRRPSRKIGDGNVLMFDHFTTLLSGVCDLAMIGNEKRNVEHEYQKLTDGPAVVVTGDDGAFVQDLGGRLYQLQEIDRANQVQAGVTQQHRPARGLPNDAVFVVRTEALQEFEQSINDLTKKEKPFEITERNSLLTIIAALCNYSDIKHDGRGAATQIAKLTEEIGAAVSDDTVRRALKKISDALESRMK